MSDASLPPCLYCSGCSYELLFDRVQDRLRYVAGTWSFWRCRECGSALLAPFPKVADLAGYYPPVYSFTLELGKLSLLQKVQAKLEYWLYFRPYYEAQTQLVLRNTLGGATRGRRLLDFGCGRGLRLLSFRRRGLDVTGTDLQPEVVDYVRNQLGIPALCATVDKLPETFAPASFDLITAFFVLEHVPDVAEVLEACYRLLKPGGWFVAAVPVVDCIQAGLFGSRWINVTEAPRHLSLPTKDGLRRVFQRVGYERIKFEGESVLNCAGQVGLSLFPTAAITHVYGGGRARSLLTRLAAGAVAVLAIPACMVENHLCRRPSQVLVFGRKPV